MLIVVDFEPTELFAQIVKTVPATTCVGVPQIVPLLVPKLSPAGKVALMAQEVMAPEPVRVGVSGKSVLVNPLVSVKLSGEYAIVGTSSTMTMVMVVELAPAVLRAVMV